MRTSPRWFVAAGLLATAAALLAAAVRLVWQPCAGQSPSAFTDACLAAMDTNSPLPIALGLPGGLSRPEVLTLAAMLALATAWVVVLPMLQVGPLARVALGAPAVMALAAAVAVALQAPGWSLLLLGAIDVAVVVAVLVLVNGVPGAAASDRLRYTIVLVAATAISLGHMRAEYSFATATSVANWDTPPNAGYATVVFLLLAALVTAGWCLLERRRAHTGPTPAPVLVTA